jgi:hypothetical protein
MNYRTTPAPETRPGEKWRTFNDADGTTWEVREIQNPDYDRRSGTSLIFESIGAVRRVRNFPANWFELPERELADLSHNC